MDISRRRALAMSGCLLSAAAVTNEIAYGAAIPESGQVFMLGDSIFDNKVYVGTEPAVIEHVRTQLPKEWKAVLLARDGAVVQDVEVQRKMPVTPGQFVFVSAGGNDALQSSGILTQKVKSSAEVFSGLADIAEAFAKRYEKMVKTIVALGGHTTLCTIYDPNFDVPAVQRNAKAALTLFNDCITRTAVVSGLPILDLRIAFSEAADYANTIEPSSAGGLKIAKLVRRVVAEHDFKNGGTRVYC
jgi:hypothetical protein